MGLKELEDRKDEVQGELKSVWQKHKVKLIVFGAVVVTLALAVLVLG